MRIINITDRVRLDEFELPTGGGYTYQVDASGACVPPMPKMEIVKVGSRWSVRVDGAEAARAASRNKACVQLGVWVMDHLAEIGA